MARAIIGYSWKRSIALDAEGRTAKRLENSSGTLRLQLGNRGGRAIDPALEGGIIETVESADGAKIALERTGSGPPLVLVAGGGGNEHTRWDLGGVHPAVAEDYTVYATDHRGRGESADAAEHTMERELEDVAAVGEPGRYGPKSGLSKAR